MKRNEKTETVQKQFKLFGCFEEEEEFDESEEEAIEQ